MSILVCGSLAFDTVMSLSDKFRVNNSPNPDNRDYRHLVPDLRRGFGGNAGNIVYNLKILGRKALPMATVGSDFGPYAERLESLEIDCRFIKTFEHNYTAQTYITQDAEDNRIVAFHPGAMEFSHFNRIPQIRGVKIGVIAPDGYNGMLMHARQFDQMAIPFLFYPGNIINEFLSEELLGLIEEANWLVINELQLKQLQDKLGLTPAQISERVDAFVINCRQKGCVIYTDGATYQIPTPRPKAINDLSGSDDAFCAGLLYGLIEDIDWETTGRCATLLWAINVEHYGTQGHSLTPERFKALFQKVFGYALIT